MRSWLDVSLEAVRSNAAVLARLTAPSAFCGVVKSNAYGLGLVPIANALVQSGLPRLSLAVFSPEEGLSLRDAGVETPIVVVGPADDLELAHAARARLECALLDESDVDRFAPHRLTVHVKVDTGVARFGVAPARTAAVLARCADAGLRVAGVYSHLANAEDLDEAFTFEQVRRLTAAAPQRNQGKGVVTHIAASAAAILWPQTRLDMVRFGIALYGFWPSPQVRGAAAGALALLPAARWFAPVAQVRSVEPGETVGYGCEFVPARPSAIAVLAIGYADGLPRAAGGGKFRVLLNGHRVPVVGRVCMNACMIDVTDVLPAPTRADVAELEIDALAQAAGTINYEILARLPASLERRYA